MPRLRDTHYLSVPPLADMRVRATRRALGIVPICTSLNNFVEASLPSHAGAATTASASQIVVNQPAPRAAPFWKGVVSLFLALLIFILIFKRDRLKKFISKGARELHNVLFQQSKRVAILVNGSRGDVQPSIALAHKLKGLGHTVRILTTFDLVPFTKEAGIDALPVFADGRAVIVKMGGRSGSFQSTTRAAIQAAKEWTQEHPGACTEPPIALKDFSPDVVLYASTSSGPAIAYELEVGAPAIPMMFERGSLDKLSMYATMPPARPSLLATSPLLDVKPELPAEIPMHQTGPWFFDEAVNLPNLQDLEKFLSAGPTAVAIGWGSMIPHGQSPADLLMLALQGLRSAGRRGVIIGGWARLHEVGHEFVAHGTLPPSQQARWLDDEVATLVDFAKTDCFFVPAISHTWLFPRCSCVVHHGGAGTVHAVLRAARPSVVTPILADQPKWSAAIAEAGAGIGFVELLPDITAEMLGKAIVDAEGLSAAAASLSKQMAAEPGVEQAAAVLNSFFRQSVDSNKFRMEWSKIKQERQEKQEMVKARAAARKEAEEKAKAAAEGAASAGAG